MTENEEEKIWTIANDNKREIETVKTEITGMKELINYKIDDLFDKFKELSTQRRDIKKGLVFPTVLIMINILAVVVIKWG